MKYYPEEIRDYKLPQDTVCSFMQKNNRHRLQCTALHYYGANITYGELFERIDDAANAFAAIGVKQGDLVSFLSVGTPETIAALYALNKIGAAANTIDPRMDISSIRRMIKSAGSRVLLVIDLAFPKVKRILSDIDDVKIIVVSASSSLPFFMRTAMRLTVRTDIPYSEKIVRFSDFIKGGAHTVALEAPYVGDATVAITYTGGTTGFPKGVMLTNDSMNAVVLNFMHCGIEYNYGDRFLGIMPIFSSYGMVCGLHMPLCMCLELVNIPKFVPEKLGSLIKRFRPQHLISTPAFYEFMMQSREVQKLDLSFLVTLGSGGDTMNAGLEQKLSKFMKEHNMTQPLAQGYGMSELSAAATFCVGKRYKPGSVGIPSLTTTVSIFDPETGEELSYGQQGEICVTGPSMMKGYFNDDAETEYIMRRHDDGQIWIHSGDVGYMDEDGFLFVKGRIKRMITRFDGHKVFPVNLEAAVSRRADVRNCAVIGVDDREHAQGQYPMVLVEFTPGIDRERACREIYEFCRKNAEERGRPVAVVALDAIPLTGMGKNDHCALEKEYSYFDYNAWRSGR